MASKYSCKGCDYTSVKNNSRKRYCSHCEQADGTRLFWENSDEAKISVTLAKAKFSYNYCGICGHSPSANEMPNYAPLRWWDCDDGWKIGTLCEGCAKHNLLAKPKPEDYAYAVTNNVCDDENTDEDPTMSLFE